MTAPRVHPAPPPVLALDRAPIVVGVARGGSDAAVLVGAREADRTSRPLDLIHVTTLAAGWHTQLGRDSLRVAAERARGVAGPGLVVSSGLRDGSVLPMLVRAAAHGAMLVVERRRGVELRRRETSTTVRVADTCDVPVLVVPAEWLGNSRGVVTVGLDPERPDDRSLSTAMGRARLSGAALRVLVAIGTSAPDESALRATIDARLAGLGGDACDLAVEVVRGPAGAALLAAGETSDLVVLGRATPGLLAGSRLGRVSTQVLREAACPVLMTMPGVTSMVRNWTVLDGETPATAARAGVCP